MRHQYFWGFAKFLLLAFCLIVQPAFSSASNVEPVDYEDLKKMLPTKFAGFKQTDNHGGRKSMFGLRISQAEATYEGKKEGRIEISIIDYGSVKGIAGKAVGAWMSAEIDNESDDGYEKTTEFKGYKAFEKYSFKDKKGTLSVIIAERFLVDVDGNGVDMSDIKKGMSGVNLKKLKSLKSYGISK
ncbi:hypothetical protein EH223_13755 [candidate division KSB1 bacterium]|nr:hypothetical protein [candidate division KSB1 bacterium]RQW01957.1 MAG: hypothetical protein EH223_13755 [candidate division KSB1 bacterium]